MRIVAAAGLALVLVALVAKALLLHGTPAPIAVPEPVHHLRTPAAHHARHTVLRPQVDPTLPAALRRALARHGVVVAVLYAPHVPGDDGALNAARRGAQNAHAGFAVLNVRNESVAKVVARKLPGSSDPSVVVVRRPGTVAVLITGYADHEAVAEAVRNARQ